MLMKLYVLLISILFISNTIHAQKDKIEHVWYNEEKTSKIQIYKGADGIFYGKIVWLIRPLDIDGKPKLDKFNPDEKQK